jgi:GH15 family glucan-1,4-alpha-glucosidase
MPRDLPIGNGSLLVNFDAGYCLRDIYFPHVGRDNNTIGHPSRLGLWLDGRFAWLHGPGWTRRLVYKPATLVTDAELRHDDLGVRVRIHDAVDVESTVLLRRIEITDLTGTRREARLFCCHDFHIGETDMGDTAYFEPVNDFVIHYKGRRYFLVNGVNGDGEGIFEYATGTKESGNLEGTWRDAEDGRLAGNPIAQGSVDSAVSFRQGLPARGTAVFHVWLAAAAGYFEVKALDAEVRRRGPEAMLAATEAYWRDWVEARPPAPAALPDRVQELYRRSLLVIRTQIDNGGAVIAANDGDSSQFNRDTYSYMWPRDGALVAHALDLAGCHDLTAAFFRFCAAAMPPATPTYPEGYLLHKYNPDGSLGSSWHPWVRDGKPQLPIQEDETALVLWALWAHHERARATDSVAPLYERMIRPAAKFMLSYRDRTSGLPRESYDLWEERYGILTFTTAAVHAGLEAGARFAGLFGDREIERRCAEGAAEVKAAALRHLYRPDLGRFARMITPDGQGGFTVDPTIDASLYAVFAFGLLPADSPEVAGTMRAVERRLWVQTPIGGIARYENDYYYRRSDDTARVAGNPWPICTLWLALWLIALARAPGDLERPRQLLELVADRALPSGVLAEQFDPYTGEPLSVSPLTWSHATFVETVLAYGARARALGAGA